MKITVTFDEGRAIQYKKFVFPDGQPHITLDEEIIGAHVMIEASVTSPDDLFELLLLKDVLDEGDNIVSLHLRYLMGGRMDRRINSRQPNTLGVVTDIIRQAYFYKITMLDPHSETSLAHLDAKAVYPSYQVRRILKHYSFEDTCIVIPDKGAAHRVEIMTSGLNFNTIQCSKDRDPNTGALSGFTILNPQRVKGMRCFIIDDICDGGGTFVGLAKELRAAGAISVDLFVTHGIFSKGRNLEGIDNTHSTESFPGDIV